MYRKQKTEVIFSTVNVNTVNFRFIKHRLEIKQRAEELTCEPGSLRNVSEYDTTGYAAQRAF